MPAPLDPAKRDAITADIRDGAKTRNQIARDHAVSGATVSKIAKHIEDQTGSPPFEQSQTKRARERRLDDLAARRTELAHLLMDDAFRLRERMWQMQAALTVVPRKGGGADAQVIEVPASAGDHRNYMTAVGIAVDKVRVLSEVQEDTTKAVTLLERLMESVDAR